MNDLIAVDHDESEKGFMEGSSEHPDDMGGRLAQVEQMLSGGGEQQQPASVPDALQEDAKQFAADAVHLQALRDQVTEIPEHHDLPVQADDAIEVPHQKRSWREHIKGFFAGLKNAFRGRRHREIDSSDIGGDETGEPIGVLAAQREMRDAGLAEPPPPLENAA